MRRAYQWRISMSKYGKTKCDVCGEMISNGGAAYTSHQRAHVRRKEAVEFRRGNKLLFVPAGACARYIEEQPYARLGEEPLPGQPKDVWSITEALKELKAVDPAQYYVTSGEAIKKAEKLVKDAYSLAVRSKSFRDRLISARGSKKYLETSREDNHLLVKSKDPRSRS